VLIYFLFAYFDCFFLFLLLASVWHCSDILCTADVPLIHWSLAVHFGVLLLQMSKSVNNVQELGTLANSMTRDFSALAGDCRGAVASSANPQVTRLSVFSVCGHLRNTSTGQQRNKRVGPLGDKTSG